MKSTLLCCAALLLALLTMASYAGHQAQGANARIGSYYADALNGVAFITDDDQAAFLFRVGWVTEHHYESDYRALDGKLQRVGMAAPDGSAHRLIWKAESVSVVFDWGKTSDNTIVGRVQSDGPIRVTLETLPAWKPFITTYALAPNGLTGSGQGKSGTPVAWSLQTNHPIVAKLCLKDASALGKAVVAGQTQDDGSGPTAALVFDLKPGEPIDFSAGFGALPNPDSAGSFLAQSEQAYSERRPAADGDWGDFVEPIANSLNHSRVYNYRTHRIAHIVSRGWCPPDGQVLFEWDSFFNALLASLDDPEGAKATVRAILATQQDNGLIPNMTQVEGSTGDRSQPPVGALCVWKFYQRWPDKAFLAEVYPALAKWHAWWFAPHPPDGHPYRDGNRDGLLEWGSDSGGLQEAKWESGLDDSPMFDDAMMDKNTQTMRLDSVGLSSLWAMDAEFLARIARELGKPDEAARFQKQRDDMADRINKLLWNEKLSIYCNRYWEPQKLGTLIDAPNLSTASGEPGLTGEYFSGTDFQNLKATRVDARVNFKWNEDRPLKEIGDGAYSIRWSGKLKPSVSGAYLFQIRSTSGARLWIDGKSVLDAPKSSEWARLSSQPVSLQAGKSVDIKLEYATDGRTSTMQLYWFTPQTEPEILSDRISPTCFYPLIAGIPSPQQAQRMLQTLVDPTKFWGEFVCPTIARDDPAFPRQHYWRGKIWAPTNYLMYQGLKRYASDAVRQEFARKSVTLFMNNWNKRGRCNENYFSTGEGSGDNHYTWGALLLLIGVEEIADLEPDGQMRLNGTWRDDLRIRRLPFAGQRYDVHVRQGRAELSLQNHIVLQSAGTSTPQPLPHP